MLDNFFDTKECIERRQQGSRAHPNKGSGKVSKFIRLDCIASLSE